MIYSFKGHKKYPSDYNFEWYVQVKRSPCIETLSTKFSFISIALRMFPICKTDKCMIWNNHIGSTISRKMINIWFEISELSKNFPTTLLVSLFFLRITSLTFLTLSSKFQEFCHNFNSIKV